MAQRLFMAAPRVLFGSGIGVPCLAFDCFALAAESPNNRVPDQCVRVIFPAITVRDG